MSGPLTCVASVCQVPVEREVGGTAALRLLRHGVVCELLGGRTRTSEGNITRRTQEGGGSSPGEYLVAELGGRPVHQLPAVGTARVGCLVRPGGSDHKAEAQVGVQQG